MNDSPHHTGVGARLTRASVSIRTRLTILVTACILPAALLATALVFHQYQVQRAQLIRNTVLSARTMAESLTSELVSIESGLHVLAKSPLLISGNIKDFYQNAIDVLPLQNAKNYVLLDSTGQQQLNTLRPFGAPLPVVGGPPQLMGVFTTNKTTVTDLFIGPVTGKPTLAMGVPVYRNDKLVYSLNVGIAPERVAALLHRQHLPPGWIGAVLDRTGILIARTHESERFVGKSAVPDLVAAAKKASEGTIESITLEGIPVISSFSRVEISGWTVVIGIPTSTLTNSLKKSILLLLGVTLFLLAAGLVLAWYHGRRITSAIRGLISPALQLGRGESVHVPPLFLKEANEVGAALMVASAMLHKAQHDAHYDGLTGLANRAMFHEILDLQLALAERQQTPLALLYLDLDGFKAVNDTFGHAIGDDLLRAVAFRINEEIRASDVAARFGGDEFVLLLVQAGDESAALVSQKLIATLSKSYELGQRAIHVSASIGVAIYPDSGVRVDVLLARADAAMYEAKRLGKGRFFIAS